MWKAKASGGSHGVRTMWPLQSSCPGFVSQDVASLFFVSQGRGSPDLPHWEAKAFIYFPGSSVSCPRPPPSSLALDLLHSAPSLKVSCLRSSLPTQPGQPWAAGAIPPTSLPLWSVSFCATPHHRPFFHTVLLCLENLPPPLYSILRIESSHTSQPEA